MARPIQAQDVRPGMKIRHVDADDSWATVMSSRPTTLAYSDDIETTLNDGRVWYNPPTYIYERAEI